MKNFSVKARGLYFLFWVLWQTYLSAKKVQKNSSELLQVKKDWCDKVFSRLNIEVQIKGHYQPRPATLFLGNHISYLDIAVLFKAVPEVSFVAKAEISKWPIFGLAAQATHTVYVERSEKNSRAATQEAIKKALLQGRCIALFPAGTTTLTNNFTWRKGAFEISKEVHALLTQDTEALKSSNPVQDFTSIKPQASYVQPFRLTYEPLRTVAYIDDDHFLAHLITLLGQKKIKATLEFDKPFLVTDAIQDAENLKQWCQAFIQP